MVNKKRTKGRARKQYREFRSWMEAVTLESSSSSSSTSSSSPGQEPDQYSAQRFGDKQMITINRNNSVFRASLRTLSLEQDIVVERVSPRGDHVTAAGVDAMCRAIHAFAEKAGKVVRLGNAFERQGDFWDVGFDVYAIR